MDLRVFTQRSSAVALATGVLVSVTLGQFGAPWGLATITGLPAGATVLAVSFSVRNGMFRARRRPGSPAPWVGAFLVGQVIVLVPFFQLDDNIPEVLNWATEAALELLFLLTGFAALAFGYITRMLEQLDSADDMNDTSQGQRDPVAQ